jgi:hypothetical protein
MIIAIQQHLCGFFGCSFEPALIKNHIRHALRTQQICS